MENIFVDTNMVMDLLSKREGFYHEAQELFTLADDKEVNLFVLALTIANIYYLISKNNKPDEARKILSRFKLLVKDLPLDDKILELAFISDFKDFEDAIQYHNALENNLDSIITRNKKDFKNAKLLVMTAKEYLMK